MDKIEVKQSLEEQLAQATNAGDVWSIYFLCMALLPDDTGIVEKALRKVLALGTFSDFIRVYKEAEEKTAIRSEALRKIIRSPSYYRFLVTSFFRRWRSKS